MDPKAILFVEHSMKIQLLSMFYFRMLSVFAQFACENNFENTLKRIASDFN